jgi:serine O-acetyltransferase
VVGVPGRVVTEHAKHTDTGAPLLNLEHGELPDPVVRTLSAMATQIQRLEQDVARLRGDAVSDDGTPATRDEPGAPSAGK